MMLKGSIVHLSIPQSPSRLLMDLNTGWYVHDFLCVTQEQEGLVVPGTERQSHLFEVRTHTYA